MPDQSNTTPSNSLVSTSMIVLSIAVLVSLNSDFLWPKIVAFSAFAVFATAAYRLYGRREKFLLLLATGLTIIAWIQDPTATTLLASALDRATFLAAFMILLSLLREGAVTSPSVLAVGSYLTRQPPSRRYLSIHLGSHLLAILLNFGALNLLGPLIMRGIRDSEADPRVVAIRQERQISALLRGFSWMVAWSPTAITQALVFAVVPGVDPARMLGIGLLLVLLTTLAGWGFDWLSGVRARRVIPASARPQFIDSEPFPKRAFWNFGAICACLAGATVLAILVLGVTIVPALMLIAPIVTGLWILQQVRDQERPIARFAERLGTIATRSIPRGSPEAVTLACAGYCGICAAGLVDPHWFSDRLALDEWHQFHIYAAAMLLPALLSNIGLPPLMVITFFGTLLSGMSGLHYDPTLLAMAFCVGWALNLTGSPLGLSAVILARITGVTGRDLSWRWNGWYTVTTFVLSAIVLVVFAN